MGELRQIPAKIRSVTRKSDKFEVKLISKNISTGCATLRDDFNFVQQEIDRDDIQGHVIMAWTGNGEIITAYRASSDSIVSSSALPTFLKDVLTARMSERSQI